MSDTPAPAPVPAPAPAPWHSWTRTPAAKLGMAMGLVVVLQAPLLAVSSLIAERQDRQEDVLTGVRRSWGPAQAVTGPTLAIPYSWTQPATTMTPAQPRQGWVQVPAKTLTATAALAPETRQRGLFRATVYTAAVKLEASLVVPDISLADVPGAQLRWQDAILAVGATDLRGQPAGGTMTVNGHALPLSVQAGWTGQCAGAVSVPAGLAGPAAAGTVLAVQAQLTLRGTQSFAMVPWGEQAKLRVTAPWQTPSFTGTALPLDYDIQPAGFTADWDVSGGALGSTWRTDTVPLPACAFPTSDDQFGVDLLEAVPTYLMVNRAAKYGTLFLVLSFLTYFLIEQATRIRIHLAQYALLGLSVSLFALLLVSLAEPLGFGAGYAISTAAVMLQASLYTLSITHRARLAALFAGVLALLFGVLYLVLRLESYALLAGTATLFVTLSVVMAATRRLDWGRRSA